MTDRCRDDARRHLGRLSGADGALLLREHFVAECPEMDLVAAALDELAEFHDYHGQPLQAAKYRSGGCGDTMLDERQTREIIRRELAKLDDLLLAAWKGGASRDELAIRICQMRVALLKTLQKFGGRT